jgi:hypothetical protein
VPSDLYEVSGTVVQEPAGSEADCCNLNPELASGQEILTLAPSRCALKAGRTTRLAVTVRVATSEVAEAIMQSPLSSEA